MPDLPGSLGELAEAFGVIDANIQSVDIVETCLLYTSDAADDVIDV